MKYCVIISDVALQGVTEFLDYIAIQQQQPLNAERWWQKATMRLGTLELFPKRCPLAPENAWSNDELRMLIVDRGLFIFHVDDSERTVHVILFRHGSAEPHASD